MRQIIITLIISLTIISCGDQKQTLKSTGTPAELKQSVENINQSLSHGDKQLFKAALELSVFSNLGKGAEEAKKALNGMTGQEVIDYSFTTKEQIARYRAIAKIDFIDIAEYLFEMDELGVNLPKDKVAIYKKTDDFTRKILGDGEVSIIEQINSIDELKNICIEGKSILDELTN